MRRIRRGLPWGVLLLSAAGAASAAGGSTEELERTGDALQVGLPVAALVLTFLEDQVDPEGASVNRLGRFMELDGTPRHDLITAMTRTELVTYGMKYSIEAERPNGGDHSFPSGHTAAAFTGAEFIRLHYGAIPGFSAYLVAAFTGWTRVVTGNHWPHDVAAGAAIGILSNHDSLRWQGSYGTLSVRPMILTIADGEDSAAGTLPTLQVRLSF